MNTLKIGLTATILPFGIGTAGALNDFSVQYIVRGSWDEDDETENTSVLNL